MTTKQGSVMKENNTKEKFNSQAIITCFLLLFLFRLVSNRNKSGNKQVNDRKLKWIYAVIWVIIEVCGTFRHVNLKKLKVESESLVNLPTTSK